MTVNELQEELARTKEIFLQSLTPTHSMPNMLEILAMQANLDVEQPAEQSAEQPVEQPVEQPTEQPTEQPVEQPVEQPAEQPAEATSSNPSEEERKEEQATTQISAVDFFSSPAKAKSE